MFINKKVANNYYLIVFTFSGYNVFTISLSSKYVNATNVVSQQAQNSLSRLEMQFSGTKIDLKDTSMVPKTFSCITIYALNNSQREGAGRKIEFPR